MLFWSAALLMTLIACLAVLLPFLRQPLKVAEGDGADLAVYRDQIEEIGRDRARGLIAPEEAEQARAEIGRRILGLGRAAGAHAQPVSSVAVVRASALAAVVVVPAVAWGVYATIGSPYLPSQPLVARLSADPSTSSVDELIVRAERHLADNPGDGRGWEVLGPVYLRQGRAEDAVRAWQSAIRVEGSNAVRETGLGEALIAVAGGVVTADARAAFERALAVEPASPKASYYLALALGQEGHLAAAVERWRAMKATLPGDSPWHEAVDNAIKGTEERIARAATAETVEAMSPDQRAEMIEEMVAGLDRRLRDDPSNPDGWQRLIRSYMVLGKPDAAREALKRSQAGLATNPEAAKAVSDFAMTLGVTAVE